MRVFGYRTNILLRTYAGFYAQGVLWSPRNGRRHQRGIIGPDRDLVLGQFLSDFFETWLVRSSCQGRRDAAIGVGRRLVLAEKFYGLIFG